jgi:hypothetical protein
MLAEAALRRVSCGALGSGSWRWLKPADHMLNWPECLLRVTSDTAHMSAFEAKRSWPHERDAMCNRRYSDISENVCCRQQQRTHQI